MPNFSLADGVGACIMYINNVQTSNQQFSILLLTLQILCNILIENLNIYSHIKPTLQHIPGKAVVREARGTQYSERSVGGTSRGTELSRTTDVSRSEMSNGSYMADSFDESYTRSDPSDPSTKYLALAAKKQAEVKLVLSLMAFIFENFC